MHNPRDEDGALRDVNRVDDPVVTHALSVVISTDELDAAAWARVAGEAVDRRRNPFAHRAVKAPIGTSRRRVEADLEGRLGRSLLPNVCPGHGELDLIAGLEGSKAVLEILDAVDQLGVPIDIDEDACQPTAFRDVERLVGVAQRIELASQTST